MTVFNLKRKLITLLMLVGVSVICFGQSGPIWSNFDKLIGKWVGDGAGQPGQGNGTFTFNFDLDKKILVRKGHTYFPKTDTKSEITHDDLMIIYPDYTGMPSKAIYFDNEGHTINYSVLCSDKSIVFTSTKINNVPVFRLTYTLLDNDMINTKFEMSRDGEVFTPYLEGKSKKVK
ncbi:MAG: hypothetical protein PHT07_12855 [Paludibacter sp.]|nr:hypothetical protein [Paludibacter sp.]